MWIWLIISTCLFWIDKTFLLLTLSPAQIKRQFVSGSLIHRAQFAIEGELNRDFQPVLVTQMVSRVANSLHLILIYWFCCIRVTTVIKYSIYVFTLIILLTGYGVNSLLYCLLVVNCIIMTWCHQYTLDSCEVLMKPNQKSRPITTIYTLLIFFSGK